MRHSLITLAASAVLAGLALGAAPASAAPLPKIDSVTSQAASPVEAVRYYRRWGYRPYAYRQPYRGYYAPRPYYRNYGYGYGYRPYYRNYGYWNRPYYGRRYW
jgi:hypothetical protein